MSSSATLEDISRDLDPKQKAEKYEEYLDTVVALGDMGQCKEFADHGTFGWPQSQINSFSAWYSRAFKNSWNCD